MFRRVPKTVLLLGVSVLGLVWVARAGGDEPKKVAAGSFKPVASVHTLMEGQGLFFKKLGAAVGNPQAPKRAGEIAFSAEMLAELGNVNTHNSDKSDYVQWAGQVRDTAMELAGVAKSEGDLNEDKVKALFGRLESTCKACHEKYQ